VAAASETPLRACTDLGNAERLVDRCASLVRYDHVGARWLVWDGTRWVIDRTDQVGRLAKETVRGIRDEASRAGHERRRRLLVHALASESDVRIRAMLSRAKAEQGLAVTRDRLDANPLELNVANGILDLRTSTLRPHRPDAYATKLAPVQYDSGAECRQWLRFLSRVFDGDAPLIAYLQRAVGYSLTGKTGEDVLFLLHGSGANGKSTLLEVLRLVMGEYAACAAFDTFVQRRGDGGPREDIARLDGARFVTATEGREGRRLDEALIKSVTGGDTVTARHLYQGSFEFVPQFKLWLATNHLPRIEGGDDAIWRRIRLIPFGVQIPEAERDPGLVDRLTTELPGILAWAVEGARSWAHHGLGDLPGRVRSATAEYRSESDVIRSWIEDARAEERGYRESSGALYDSYREWCGRSGEYPCSRQLFGRRLTQRGIEGERDTRGFATRVGLRLRRQAAACVMPIVSVGGGLRRAPTDLDGCPAC
jgi:putative DNA primase/helicase